MCIGSSYSNHTKTNYFQGLETSPQQASSIVMGSSYIFVPENAKVVTQVDRVIKDVASNVNVDTHPDQSPNSSKQLVPYMEGARVGELMDYADVKVIPVTGVTIKNINGNWYGPDENGNFVFGVDPSKAGPLFSINGSDNLTKIEVNTHGMNVLVPGAINNDAKLVVACGDLPGKADAEKYLSKRGINCYAPCDRFTAVLMPYNGTGIIMGGEPIRKYSGGKAAIIGAQPVAIDMNETIVIQTTKKAYPDQYCDTPNRYFNCLQNAYNITLKTVVVDAGRGETEKVINATRTTGSKVIGVRVATAQDKIAVENWLKSDQENRAILFHSAAYEPGYSLFIEFPYQVTGQDINPVFVKQTSHNNLNQIFDEIRSLWN
jgi:hypothetical protein